MSLEFKVYLLGPDGEEIRRISIPGLDYGYLRHEICYRFSISRHDNFSLYWKDSEGDQILISSEKEIEIALAEASSVPLKLYIIPKGQKVSNVDHPKDTPRNNVPVHTTVTCDECRRKPLQGYRYKCLICPDYDLCTNCEKSEMIHSEHPMIRLPVPLNGEKSFGWQYQGVKGNIYGTLKYLLESS